MPNISSSNRESCIDNVFGLRFNANMRALTVFGCFVIVSTSLLEGQETLKDSLDPFPQPTIEPDDRGRMIVKLADPENNFWAIESSTDLRTWRPMKTLFAKDGRISYRHDAARFERNLYYRVVNANTTDRVLSVDLVPSYRHWIPHYFDERARVLFVSSSGSGGWAGNRGSIDQVITFQEPVVAEDVPLFEDRGRDHIAFAGRVLFYDKRLSADNSKSCASCHKQEHAFADNKALSDGVFGQKTLRNSMPLANLAFTSGKGKFFWDLRESTLRETVLKPIENSREMAMDLSILPEKLSREPYYATVFENAFGSSEITEERIAEGLAAFLNSMVSSEAKIDFATLTGFGHLTLLELMGRNLFMGKAGCAQCHSSPFFDASFPTNNGLDLDPKDLGVATHTKLEADKGHFKTPSLRNIELTAPYMHDGRFKTLKEVVNFYNNKIEPHPELDVVLRGRDSIENPWSSMKAEERKAVRLDLTEQERHALVAFMETLTDYKFTHDERFSNPFKR